jgi:6-phosphofructokinase 1
MEKLNRFFEGQTLAILTGGGDTPALNASIEALKCRASVLGFNIYGIREGWKGLLGDGDIVNLTGQPYDGWYGGTALRSSRTNPLPSEKNPVSRVPQVMKNLKRYKIDVLVTIGGDDTNGAAKAIYEQEGIPVIGFPKTIDNDLRTRTFHQYKNENIEACLCPGFPTAAKNIMDYAAKICTTSESHSRIIVLEVMGRDAGWLTGAASFGGANMALVPEYEMTEERIEQFYKKVIEVYKDSPKKSLVIAVSEGTRWYNTLKRKTDVVCASSETDEFGHPRFGGISSIIANEIEKRTGIQARGQITGYFARSGECSKYDKRFVNILADRVLDMLIRKDYGKMPVLSRHTKMNEIEEYNTLTIDMGQIENKSLPGIYYDSENFDFHKSYMDFLGHILKKPRGFLFDYNFPKVEPFI